MNEAPGAERPHDAAEASRLADTLVDWFEPDKTYVVALSGGVDSAVVAAAAFKAGAAAQLVTASSSALSQVERQDVVSLLQRVDLPHRYLDTDELLDENYRANSASRCYYCKSELFSKIRQHFSEAVILTGTNLDDLSDYRPGLKAASEAGVQQPLADLGFDKARVRSLARHWELHLAEKPASPCLASRIAHGVPVTARRLEMVEQAELALRQLGLSELRVRLHEGEIARIEVPDAQLSSVFESRRNISAKLKLLGFRFVTLDLEGFRSGSLNPLVEISLPTPGLPNTTK